MHPSRVCRNQVLEKGGRGVMGNMSKRIQNFPKELGVLLLLGKIQKSGLFNYIDQISFNTHPPPPKDDI